MQNWRTQAQTVLQAGNGRFFKVEYHTVELPDGQVIEEWPWLITPDFVNVVAETAAGDICRWTKYVRGGVAGGDGRLPEPGEDLLTAAQRELLEEIGYVAAEWIDWASKVDGNCGGTAHLFLARAEWRQPIDADDLEEQELLLTRAECALRCSAGIQGAGGDWWWRWPCAGGWRLRARNSLIDFAGKAPVIADRRLLCVPVIRLRRCRRRAFREQSRCPGSRSRCESPTCRASAAPLSGIGWPTALSMRSMEDSTVILV